MLARLFKNALSLMIAGVVDKFSYVLFFAIIARKLSQTDFGAYNLILTLVFIGGLLSNFGIEYVIVREVAKNRDQATSLFRSSLAITACLSLLAWPIIIGLAYALDYPPRVITLISWSGIVFLFTGLSKTASAILKAFERMEIFALISSFISLLGLILGITALWLGGEVAALVGVLVITEALKALFVIRVVHRHFTALGWQIDRALVSQILRQMIPFALLMAYGILMRRTDMLLLGWLKPLDDVAVYGAAGKFADFLGLFSSSLVGALYPAFSARLAGSREDSWQLYTDSIGIFGILGFGALFSILILAEPIVALLFGQTYIVGADAVRWLALAFLFSVLSGPVGTLLLAAGDQMTKLLIMSVIVLSGNIVLNLLLIPVYSYNGAALATCISMFLGFMGRLILSRIYFGELPNFFRIMWRSFFAGLLMAAALYLIPDLNLFLRIFIGFAVFFATLGLIGEFRARRYNQIRAKLKTILTRFGKKRV